MYLFSSYLRGTSLLRKRHLPTTEPLSGGCNLQSEEILAPVTETIFVVIGIALPAAEAAREPAIKTGAALALELTIARLILVKDFTFGRSNWFEGQKICVSNNYLRG